MDSPTLDTAQQFVALLLSVAGVAALGWKLFDSASKTFELKMLREMYEAEVEWKEYYRDREVECRSELSQCQGNRK